MAHAFDAQQEAVKVETMARDLMHTHTDLGKNPVDIGPLFENQKSALEKELTGLYNNPEHMKAVGKEFEKSNSTIFSLMPNIDITTNQEGTIESLSFTPALLDLKGRGGEFSSNKDYPVYFSDNKDASSPSLGNVPFPFK